MDVIGTWKNKLSFRESLTLATNLQGWLAGHTLSVDLQLLPSAVALNAVRALIPPTVELGCQNIGWDARHALTGETSANAAREAGASFVMIGHSERRTYLSETNDQVAAKLRAALAAGLGALVCIGETYAERNEGRTKAVVTEQVDAILPILSEFGIRGVRIAYEPAWAITTSQQSLPANPTMAANDHAFIRDLMVERLGANGGDLPLIYGAGVNIDNVTDFAQTENVDGVLVGGASQTYQSLTAIVEKVEGSL